MEEKIQENERAYEDLSVEKTQVNIPRKKHDIASLVKDMWPAYLIEIIVIILGISITLGMEAWRDSTKEEKLEQTYLKNLKSDIEADLRSLQYVIIRSQKLLEQGNELLVYSRNLVEKIPISRVNEDIRGIIGRPKFIPSEATFSDLKSTGNLHLLKDIQLKNLLFSYYNQIQNIRENQESEQLATVMLSGPYFLKHFSLDDSVGPGVILEQENIHEILKNVEFRNNVLLRVSNRNELFGIYKKADSTALKLQDALAKHLD